MIREKCDYYEISRRQRSADVSKSLGLEGTVEYREWGCYACKGEDDVCENYFYIVPPVYREVGDLEDKK